MAQPYTELATLNEHQMRGHTGVALRHPSGEKLTRMLTKDWNIKFGLGLRSKV
jgi:hypothetical protein